MISAKKALRKLLVNDGLNPHKKQLVDIACQQFGMTSFADLGAKWRVEGGYTLYALESYRIDKAVAVDMDLLGPKFREKRAHLPQLRTVQGNFGSPSVRDEVGEVEGVFFFDTLLHQVRPDWNQVLEMYRDARLMLVFNQQFTEFGSTQRLVDLAAEEYFRDVPHKPDEEPYKSVFADLDAVNPIYERKNRDIPAIWQWGITDADLISCMSKLGYRLQFFRNCGHVLGQVENHAFIFAATA